MRKISLLLSGGARQLLGDDRGFILSAELVLVLTLGVLAMVVGIHAVAKSINAELIDVAQAFGNMNQSFRVHGFSYCWFAGVPNAATGGSGFIDGSDICDCAALIVTGGVANAAGGPGVVSTGPVGVTAAPVVPCPGPCPPGDVAVPCPGDCPCGPDGVCPPGEMLGPGPGATPSAPATTVQPVEPKPESK